MGKSADKRKLYKVRAVYGNSVEIVPYNELECDSCSSSCATCVFSITASNPKHLDLKPGMIVRSNISNPTQSFLSIIALVVPIVFAIMGFSFSTEIANFLKIPPTETFKAVIVLISLFLPCTVIFAVSRHNSELVQLQIWKIEG